MVVAPGIKNPGHARFGGEEVGDGAGVAALTPDAQVEGFQPLQQHPPVERAEAWAGVAEEAVQPVLRDLRGAGDRPAEARPLAVAWLGRRTEDDGGAPFERPL